MSSCREDEWFCAALDCLDFLPDQPVVEVSRELPHCFPQDQESCEPVPADASSAQHGGKSLNGGNHSFFLRFSESVIVFVHSVVFKLRVCVYACNCAVYDIDTNYHVQYSFSSLAPGNNCDERCKLLLYGTLVKHYSHTDRPPLLPQHMTDIYTAITDLLGKNLGCGSQ